MKITPLDIQQTVFRTAFRGYDKEEVREVLGQLGDDGAIEDLLRDALRMLAGGR